MSSKTKSAPVTNYEMLNENVEFLRDDLMKSCALMAAINNCGVGDSMFDAKGEPHAGNRAVLASARAAAMTALLADMRAYAQASSDLDDALADESESA